MIKYLNGDILESPAEVLVCPVNTVGVMTSGLALQFRYRFPETYRKFQDACFPSLLNMGNLMITKETDKRVMLFPVRSHWLSKPEKQFIEAGLQKFVDTYKKRKITSIAFPKLGCESAELNWEEDVQPLMEKYLGDLDIEIYIY